MNKQGGGFLMGMIVGLLIGLSLALGVALYVTKVPVPFVNKVPQRTAEQDTAEALRNKNWDPNAPLAGKTPRPANAASGQVGQVPDAPASAASVASDSKPKAAPAAASSAESPSATASAPTKTPPETAAAKATGDGMAYFVQAGAYARTEDAEQQRARLAMLGFDAKITEREQAGRTVYRVRVGPFNSRDQADASKTSLEGAGVEAALVRVQK
ncbi:MAG: SPOR domain-containing protein [Burkholderiales bacterium]